jgi:hypothetical protein
VPAGKLRVVGIGQYRQQFAAHDRLGSSLRTTPCTRPERRRDRLKLPTAIAFSQPSPETSAISAVRYCGRRPRPCEIVCTEAGIEQALIMMRKFDDHTGLIQPQPGIHQTWPKHPIGMVKRLRALDGVDQS